MGCVEVSEAGVEPSEEGDASGRELLQHLRDKVSRLDASGLERAREERGEAERALATLKRYAPEKGKLLQPRPDLKEGELFDQGAGPTGPGWGPRGQRGRAPHGCHPQRAVQAAGPKGRFGALAGTGTCP